MTSAPAQSKSLSALVSRDTAAEASARDPLAPIKSNMLAASSHELFVA